MVHWMGCILPWADPRRQLYDGSRWKSWVPPGLTCTGCSGGLASRFSCGHSSQRGQSWSWGPQWCWAWVALGVCGSGRLHRWTWLSNFTALVGVFGGLRASSCCCESRADCAVLDSRRSRISSLGSVSLWHWFGRYHTHWGSCAWPIPLWRRRLRRMARWLRGHTRRWSSHRHSWHLMQWTGCCMKRGRSSFCSIWLLHSPPDGHGMRSCFHLKCLAQVSTRASMDDWALSVGRGSAPENRSNCSPEQCLFSSWSQPGRYPRMMSWGRSWSHLGCWSASRWFLSSWRVVTWT